MQSCHKLEPWFTLETVFIVIIHFATKCDHSAAYSDHPRQNTGNYWEPITCCTIQNAKAHICALAYIYMCFVLVCRGTKGVYIVSVKQVSEMR